MIENKTRPGLPILEPRNASEQLQNKFAALRFENIMQKQGAEISSIMLIPKRLTENSNISGVIVSEISKTNQINNINIPNMFKFPAYLINIYEGDSSMSPFISYFAKIETPYGELPEYVISADNSIYSFRSSYLLNKNGQAVKLNNVTEGRRRFSEKEKQLLIKLSFIPKKEHSSFSRLDNEDYLIIGNILAHAEKGKITVKKPRTATTTIAV